MPTTNPNPLNAIAATFKNGETSVEEENKLIAVKIQPKCKYHEPLLGQRATLAKSFNIEAISKAIEDA